MSFRFTRPFSNGITSTPRHSIFFPVGSATRWPRRIVLAWVAVAVHSCVTTPSRGVEPARLEADVGPGLEDRGDVLAHLRSLRGLARGVVLEHHVAGVHRHDRVEVVVVPRLVVTADRFLETLGR